MLSLDIFSIFYIAKTHRLKCIDSIPSSHSLYVLCALKPHFQITFFLVIYSVTDFVASSKLNDHVTWTEWFLPAKDDTLWAVAEDCSQCVETEDFGDKSTYYMTGNYNGCLWVTKGYCDMDPGHVLYTAL